MFHAGGTTTIEAKSGYGLDEDTELKTLRAFAVLAHEGHDIIPTYLGAHVPPREFGSPADYVEWMAAHMMPRVVRERLAVFADVFCEEGAFSLDDTRRYLEAARQSGLD